MLHSSLQQDMSLYKLYKLDTLSICKMSQFHENEPLQMILRETS